jgi:hypothetical protein
METNRVLDLSPSTNGTAKPGRKSRPKASAPAADTHRGRPRVMSASIARQVRIGATLVMGISMPLLSITLSYCGGTLLRHDCCGLAALAFGLMGCVLAVSLSHLAWAIQDITRSPRWASWSLAVAFDLALVLAELCDVSAESAGLGAVTTCLMIAVCALSMGLNCWAFLQHE